MGDADAHYKVAKMYVSGQVVEKDKEKELYHLEEAAIGGHPNARLLLGYYECNAEKAVKHLPIAAAQGEPTSINMLMDAFKEGLVSKEVLAASLRAHQAAVDATKSPQREEVEKLFQRKLMK